MEYAASGRHGVAQGPGARETGLRVVASESVGEEEEEEEWDGGFSYIFLCCFFLAVPKVSKKKKRRDCIREERRGRDGGCGRHEGMVKVKLVRMGNSA